MAARVHPGDGEVVVLMHGLVASGVYFGSIYDGLAGGSTLVIPDLLGFGHSLDANRMGFALDDHLDALEAMLEALGLSERPRVLVGHSLGAVLALHWAHRSPDRVRGVLALGAPLHATPEGAVNAIAAMGWLERLFALRTPASRAGCALMCSHRRLASWLFAAAYPRFPVPVAQAGIRHSWESYLGALEDVIIEHGRPGVVRAVAGQGIPVLLAAAAGDPVVDWSLHRELALTGGVRLAVAPGDEHQLPLANPAWCKQRAAELRGLAPSPPAGPANRVDSPAGQGRLQMAGSPRPSGSSRPRTRRAVAWRRLTPRR